MPRFLFTTSALVLATGVSTSFDAHAQQQQQQQQQPARSALATSAAPRASAPAASSSATATSPAGGTAPGAGAASGANRTGAATASTTPVAPGRPQAAPGASAAGGTAPAAGAGGSGASGAPNGNGAAGAGAAAPGAGGIGATEGAASGAAAGAPGGASATGAVNLTPGGAAEGNPAPSTLPPAPSQVDRSALLSPVTPPVPPAVGPTVAAAQGDRRAESGSAATSSEVFAEDWWSHARPVVEFHGYFRTRAELFHNFALGRVEFPNQMWPVPLDNTYTAANGTGFAVPQCGDAGNRTNCTNKTQAGANLRFRINPELHISDNVRILSQIDLLDNLVLGSTPNGASGTSSTNTAGLSDPFASLSGFASTQTAPTAGVNGWTNSIAVKRAWGEYATPIGELRFGRMPDQWGLGLMWNAGDGHDSDWQSTVDRIMFVTGIKPLDLYVAGAWDFPNEGLTSAWRTQANGGQPYDLAQLDDVNQYTAMAYRRRSSDLQRLDLARGDVVWNAGLRFTYREQLLAANADSAAANSSTTSTQGIYEQVAQSGATPLVRRGLKLYTPDIWLQLLYKKFRFEVEGAMVAGTLDNTYVNAKSYDYTDNYRDPGWNIRQFGFTSQSEFRAVEDKLRLQFGTGWASGDGGLLPSTFGSSGAGTNKTTTAGTLTPTDSSGLGARAPGSGTYREFRFHPDYRVDMILFRNLLQRVQGAYYFRPSIEYDFTRTSQGQRLGGGAAVIWSRASEFVQTPGHRRDLGLEIDLSLYYQSKDGSLNDSLGKMGGFYTMLQYGVLFPLGGLGYLPQEVSQASGVATLDTSTAHAMRWFMGIFY